MTEAAGFIEVYGLVTAFAAADAACKAANVTIDAFDKNKPNDPKLPIQLIVVVKLRGSISDVRAAVAAGADAANKVGGTISTHIIARPETDTEKMMTISAF